MTKFGHFLEGGGGLELLQSRIPQKIQKLDFLKSLSFKKGE